MGWLCAGVTFRRRLPAVVPRTFRLGTYTANTDRPSRQEIARELMDIARQLAG
jgi:hypothetical protein